MGEQLALVIENEYDASLVIAKALRENRFEAAIARSGEAALAWLATKAPDLVLLDIHLPRVPGLDILRYIHSDPRLSGVKVVVVTADARLAESLRAEADQVLVKPINFGHLRDLVRSFGPPLCADGLQCGEPLALIVEDDVDLAIIFSNALREASFETEVVEAGDIALTRLSSTAPELVVLDLHLPGAPGAEVLRHIRTDGRLAHTKVIIATAYPGMAAGVHRVADRVLLKPIGYGQMRDLAARLVPFASRPDQGTTQSRLGAS